MTELRPYQLDFYNRIRQSISAGHRRIMCVSPCGSGKSRVIEEIIYSAGKRRNTVLVLVHRREIADQLRERLSGYNNATVGMVQTVTRHLDDTPESDIIIIDEAHTALSASYLRILEYFSKSYAMYFTATPQRLDGKSFYDIADDMVESVSVRWLIDNGYLAPYEYYAPVTVLDTSKLRTKNGDYDGQQAATMMDKAKIYGDVIREYQKHADGLQAIAYCASVEHSQKVAEAFIRAGIPAKHIDGAMNPEDRAEAVRAFRDGRIRVLTNYAIVIEGFDVPGAWCTLSLRPTQSLTVHVQSTMRCMRPAPGKKAVILDFVGNYERLGLPDDNRKWTLAGRDKRTRTNERNTVLARVCEGCYRTYSGIAQICPYCGFFNGKTRAEIEADERAELERVQAAERKERRREVGRAQTREELQRIARERGYAPGWVYMMERARRKRI